MSQDTTNDLGGNISGASPLPQCAWCGMYYHPGTLHVCMNYFQPGYLRSLYSASVGSHPWTCPKCGRIWSPLTPGCAPCNDAITRGSPSTEEREP